RIVQNTLSMPMFVLAAVMVPVSLFPGWLEGVSRLIYLSWGADLLRDALSPGPVGSTAFGLFIALALGALALALGPFAPVRSVRRAPVDGGLSRVCARPLLLSPAQTMRTVRLGSVIARADFAAFYTWKTWLLGWLIRLLFQAVFYTLLGILVGDPEFTRRIVIGAAVVTCVVETMLATASTCWDRYQ